MKLSVIIPCYNGADTIAEQLDALAQQHWNEPWEVLVVDNRSTDDSMTIVRRYQGKIPNLRLIDAFGRQGQPYALNVGAMAAAGEALVFCDADDVVGEGWVAAMGTALSRHNFVACRMDIEKLNRPWVQKSHSNAQQDGLKAYTYPRYLHHAGGGTLGVKKKLHAAMGGFDEAFPYLHDTDFCWRLQLSGTELHFVPEAVSHIRYRGTLKGIYRQAIGYAEYNVLLYKKFRAYGMPELPLKAVLEAWYGFIKGFARIRSKAGLANWIWQAGWRYGRLKGCIKHHVLAP